MAASSWEATSTSLAIRKAASGEVDFGGTSRSVRSDDRQERQVDVFPIVWDALVVIVHRDNPIINIRLEQLFDIYAGQITNWQQLGGANQRIELYTHASAAEGIDYNLADLILGDPNGRLASVRQFDSTSEIRAAVEAEPAALPWSTIQEPAEVRSNC